MGMQYINYMVLDNEVTSFEAGIKLGAAYHQFIGMPINIDMVDAVADVIRGSILNQPYVDDVKVSIDLDRVRRSINVYGYTTLKSNMLYIWVRVKYGEYYAEAELRYDDRLKYPLMRLLRVYGPDSR
jgi:hypothetical protein